ncbi:hypothetical protein [Kitasatospora sp. NPDC001175]|uniref:hypothetical protein n=1 Tax=Kitasatospora sp. NPDC001175 TaxID=3157103 RepID=UPI003D068B54
MAQSVRRAASGERRAASGVRVRAGVIAAARLWVVVYVVQGHSTGENAGAHTGAMTGPAVRCTYWRAATGRAGRAGRKG